MTNAEILCYEAWCEAAISRPKSKLHESRIVSLVALHVLFFGGGCFKAGAGGEVWLRDRIKQAAERCQVPQSK